MAENNLDKLQEIVAALSQEYNMPMPEVAIEYMWTTEDMGGYAYEGIGKIILNETCFNQSEDRLLFIVAHEFKHHMQRMSGELQNFVAHHIDWNTMVCTGIWRDEWVDIRVENQLQYIQMPWEQDANLFAAEYVLKSRKQGRIAA